MSQPIADGGLQAAAVAAAASSGAGAFIADSSTQWLGVPLPVVLAALCGSAVVLSVLGSMTRSQAFGAVALGCATGTYMTKFIGWHWGVPSDVWPAVGFGVAAVAHIGLSALFGATPGALSKFLDAAIEKFRGRP
jgi:hypothetical protein